MAADTRKSVGARVQEAVGQPQNTNGKKPLKSILLSFDNGQVKAQLSIIRKWDEIIEDYGPEEPNFFCIVGGKFADLPKDSVSLIEFGRFLQGVGESIEGIKFAQSNFSAEDVLVAKERLADFRKG